MSAEDRKKWDERYGRSAEPARLDPPEWLTAHLAELPRGRALDLATGVGHAAIELARRGWDVVAVDVSPVAIELAVNAARRAGVRVHWVVADLDTYPLPSEHFDLVTVFQYLDRVALPAGIIRALAPGGVLVYETFTVDQLKLPGNHLRNPAHALDHAELLRMFSTLRVRHYREVTLGDRAVASLVAEKRSRD
jgi:SAM-dependent methyltransferase